MASLRVGRCYRHVKRAYTRKSEFKKKAFIKAVPANKIVKYDMGKPTRKYPYQVLLLSKEKIQIRHNALESARQVINRQLTKDLGLNYYFKIRTYPHHVLRENKILTGAGADRMQTGMQKAFGKPIGLAAQVKAGQAVFSVDIDEENLETARKSLEKGKSRLPCKCFIEVKKISS